MVTLLSAATASAVPAGSALAVDREKFSLLIRDRIAATPSITFIQREAAFPPSEHRYCIIAAGPLVSEKLTAWLQQSFTTGSLHFYDAIAPIVSADSIDYSIAFFESRWKKGTDDYLNCPFSEEEYHSFYNALREADLVSAREFEESRFFESCLPIEVAAQRGYKALAFGSAATVRETVRVRT